MIVSLIIIFTFSIICNFLISNYFFKFFLINNYSQYHDTHLISVPRMGGAVIYICCLCFSIFNKNLEITYVIIFSLISLIPAFLEDLRKKIKPILRLSMILISSLLIVLQIDSLPVFEINFLNNILNNYYFKVIFFTTSIACLANGMNIIDGTNGLTSFTSLIIFICLLILGIYYSEQDLITTCLLLIVLIFSFLIFNFPFSKIFLGDSGSYFLGMISGFLIIKFFGSKPDISSWLACIIIFYPVFEVIFSYVRKTFIGRSPLYPDKEHLHLRIYFSLTSIKLKKNICNPLTTLILMLIWLMPLPLFFISLKFEGIVYLILIIQILIYFLLYFSAKKIKMGVMKIF